MTKTRTIRDFKGAFGRNTTFETPGLPGCPWCRGRSSRDRIGYTSPASAE